MGLFNLFKKKNPVNLIALQRDLEILNDCAELIESTKNPQVFFERYNLYILKLAALANAQKTKQIKVTGENIIDKFERMNTEQQKIKVTNAFIDRMWADTCEKASNLKTERGKLNRIKKFKETLSDYNNLMPEQCIKYYENLSMTNCTSCKIDRRAINASKIDQEQKIEASEEYRQKIYKLYYFDYPEMPFISKDRELNTNWIEQAEAFPDQSIIPKFIMTRFSDGLLAGDVYLLYWMDKIHRKRVPAYFEYKYGICFDKEKQFLEENGFLENNKPTEKGKKAIEEHKDVIENHSKKKREWSRKRKIELTTKSKNNIVENGYTHYQYIELNCDCPACKALNGKVFPVSELEIGVNAPPMGEGCKCTISPYMDEKEFYDWLENTSNK